MWFKLILYKICSDEIVKIEIFSFSFHNLCLLLFFHSFVLTFHFLDFYFRPLHSNHVHVHVKLNRCRLNVFFNNLYFYVSYIFHRLGSNQDRGADHWSVACKSILRMNLLGILCLNVHCASEVWSSGCYIEDFIEIRNYHDYRHVHVFWSVCCGSLREVKCLFCVCEKFSEIVTI